METLLPLLLIFGVMMLPLLFISNRQKKVQQKQMELVRQLGVGEEVRTHSGFYGLIVESYDDVVILETESGAQTKWARQAIAQKVEPVEPGLVEDEGEDAESLETGDVRDEGLLPGVAGTDDDLRGDDERRER